MGLITRNIPRLISLLLIILTIASFSPSFVSPVSAAASVTKTAEPVAGSPIYPGDTIKVVLSFPGGSHDIREPADIMLVMDRTGSMNDRWGTCAPAPCSPPKKIESAKAALNTFIANTSQDFFNGSSGDRGDYVGLVSYAYTGAICSPIPTACATLEYDLSNMTGGAVGNKDKITTKVNNLCNGALNNCVTAPGPSTTIGSGLRLATQTLLSKGRVGVPRFILLATDGAQNWIPSPYELNILKDTVDNKITVFTIGIGDDVNDNIPIPSVTCFGCPNLDGIGGSSATEILKDIACQTDKNNDDDPDCINTWDPGNDLKINDLDRPRDAFFASNGTDLSDAYKKIQNAIKTNSTYRILDQINIGLDPDNLFSDWDHDPQLYDCDTKEDWIPGPQKFTEAFGSIFSFIIENVPPDKSVCVSFRATIRNDPAFEALISSNTGTLTLDVDGSIRVFSNWVPDVNCGIWILCYTAMQFQGLTEIDQAKITVVSSVPPQVLG